MTVALLLLSARVDAASVMLAGFADAEHSRSYDLEAEFAPTDNWTLGAGAGKSAATDAGTNFSGTNLRLSTDVQWRAISAGASPQRWKDSDQVRSTGVLGHLGWTADNGLSLSALVDDRRMTVAYAVTIAGQQQMREIDLDGTGFGVNLGWFGDAWNLGARYIDYRYGRSVDRVRAIVSAPSTDRFPRLQLLLASVLTRAAGAPDQQLSATLGRQFSRSSLQGDWDMQRDALTGTHVSSLSLTHGYEIGRHVQLHTTLGFSGGGAGGTVAFGGLALTLRAEARSTDQPLPPIK
jgi:hypothetical protein